MVEIVCPQCGQKMQVSLLKSQYDGPLRCSHCRAIFMVAIREGKLASARPMTEVELKSYLEIEALKSRFRGGFGRPGEG